VLQKPQTDLKDLPQVETQMVPITNDILSKVQKIKDEIAAWWNDPLGKIKEVWARITAWFKANIIDPIANWWRDTWLAQKIVGPLLEWFKNLWESIKPMAAAAWEFIKFLAIGAWEAIKFVWSALAPLFQIWWDTIVSIVKDRITFIVEVIQSIKKVLQGVIEFIHGVFTGNWREAWTGILHIFEGIFGGIKAFIKLTDSIIDVINGMLRAVVLGANAISSALSNIQFTVPEWVPSLGGQTMGISIPQVSAPQIPKLATGAVIPPNSEFLAVLGDQRTGRNIEAPEGLIRQIISEEIGKVQAQITIGFTGNLASLVRELKPYVERENVRMGGSLIKSGVTTS
jgi:hypothetical protein